MARKKEPAYETEKYTFPSRLRGLMEARGTRQKELAEAIGMRPQTVSLYVQGQSFPDVNGLEKIARFFSVSSDYLLGLSETPSIDEDIQVACKVTGLSGEAIHCLQTIANAFVGFHGKPRHEYAVKTNYEYSLLWILEQMIISESFKIMLGELGQYFLYGGVLPDEALNKDPVDLKAKEYAKFNDWLEWKGMTWVKMGDVAEMYLQQAADELKAIYKKALEGNLQTGRSDNGKH